jgi:lipopolysaccharide export system protein LptA
LGGLLLWVGGDLQFKKTAPSAPRVEELPRNLERQETGANVILQQKLTDWTFRGFNRDVGQYDLFASGREVVPVLRGAAKGTESYLAKDLKITVLSFRRDSGVVRKSSRTEVSAASGRITLDENQKLVDGTITGATTVEFLPEESAQTKPIHIETSDVNVTPLQSSAEKEAGTKLKIEAKGKTKIRIGNSEIYGNGFAANTLERQLVLASPVEMRISPEQLEPLFAQESKKAEGRIFKVTSNGNALLSEKSSPGTSEIERKIEVTNNVVLTDGYSHLFCENLSLTTGSDEKLSELSAEKNVRLDKGGLTCVGQSLTYKAPEKTITLTGAPEVTISDGTNEIFCNWVQLKEDSRYAEVKGNVKARCKTTLPAKEGAQPREEIVTLLCESAEIWFSEEENSKKMQVERAVAHGSTDKQASAEGTDFTVTGHSLEYRFDGAKYIRVDGTDTKPAELRLRGGQTASAKTIFFEPTSGATWTADFYQDVHACLTSGLGEKKSVWSLSADQRISATFLEDPPGEIVPSLVGAWSETGTAVRGKCVYKEKEFQFETSALLYDGGNASLLLYADQKPSKQKIVEGENHLSASRIEFHFNENRLILSEGVEGKVAIPPPKEAKQTSEKPLFCGLWTISCDRIELLFASKEKGVMGLEAKTAVKLEKKDAACEVKCDTLSYDRTASRIVLAGQNEKPSLKQQKNSITAKEIILQTDTNLATFQDEAEFRYSPELPDKPSFVLSSKTIMARFAQGAQKVQEVYAREDVRAKVTQPDSTVTEIRALEAVYQAGDNTISVRGSPCILTQPQITIKENEIVYDIENKVIMTRPGEKGYRWEVDPSNWRKKER